MKDNEKFCAIWYNFHNSKNVINTHGGMLLLVNLQASACNFTKSNTPLWVFCNYFTLYWLHQIAQSITNNIYTKWTRLSGDCKILLSQDKNLPQLNHWSYMPSPSIIFKHTLTPPLFEDSWGDELQVPILPNKLDISKNLTLFSYLSLQKSFTQL